MPRGFGQIVGVSAHTELIIMSFLGMVTTIMDWQPFSMNGQLQKIWSLPVEEQAFRVVDHFGYWLKTILSMVVLIRTFTTHLHVACYCVMYYPLFTKDHPTLILPWLILHAFKNIAMDLVITVAGVLLCLAQLGFGLIAGEFLIVQTITMIFSIYMWRSVRAYYLYLSEPEAYDDDARPLNQISKSKAQALAQRRRACKQIEGASFARMPFEKRQRVNSFSTIDEFFGPPILEIGDFDNKCSRSLTTLLTTASQESDEIEEALNMQFIDDPNLTPAEKSLKILGMTRADVVVMLAKGNEKMSLSSIENETSPESSFTAAVSSFSITPQTGERRDVSIQANILPESNLKSTRYETTEEMHRREDKTLFSLTNCVCSDDAKGTKLNGWDLGGNEGILTNQNLPSSPAPHLPLSASQSTLDPGQTDGNVHSGDDLQTQQNNEINEAVPTPKNNTECSDTVSDALISRNEGKLIDDVYEAERAETNSIKSRIYGGKQETSNCSSESTLKGSPFANNRAADNMLSVDNEKRSFNSENMSLEPSNYIDSIAIKQESINIYVISNENPHSNLETASMTSRDPSNGLNVNHEPQVVDGVAIANVMNVSLDPNNSRTNIVQSRPKTITPEREDGTKSGHEARSKTPSERNSFSGATSASLGADSNILTTGSTNARREAAGSEDFSFKSSILAHRSDPKDQESTFDRSFERHFDIFDETKIDEPKNDPSCTRELPIDDRSQPSGSATMFALNRSLDLNNYRQDVMYPVLARTIDMNATRRLVEDIANMAENEAASQNADHPTAFKYVGDPLDAVRKLYKTAMEPNNVDPSYVVQNLESKNWETFRHQLDSRLMNQSLSRGSANIDPNIKFPNLNTKSLINDEIHLMEPEKYRSTRSPSRNDLNNRAGRQMAGSYQFGYNPQVYNRIAFDDRRVTTAVRHADTQTNSFDNYSRQLTDTYHSRYQRHNRSVHENGRTIHRSCEADTDEYSITRRRTRRESRKYDSGYRTDQNNVGRNYLFRINPNSSEFLHRSSNSKDSQENSDHSTIILDAGSVCSNTSSKRSRHSDYFHRSRSSSPQYRQNNYSNKESFHRSPLRDRSHEMNSNMEEIYNRHEKVEMSTPEECITSKEKHWITDQMISSLPRDNFKSSNSPRISHRSSKRRNGGKSHVVNANHWGTVTLAETAHLSGFEKIVKRPKPQVHNRIVAHVSGYETMTIRNSVSPMSPVSPLTPLSNKSFSKGSSRNKSRDRQSMNSSKSSRSSKRPETPEERDARFMRKLRAYNEKTLFKYKRDMEAKRDKTSVALAVKTNGDYSNRRNQRNNGQWVPSAPELDAPDRQLISEIENAYGRLTRSRPIDPSAKSTVRPIASPYGNCATASFMNDATTASIFKINKKDAGIFLELLNSYGGSQLRQELQRIKAGGEAIVTKHHSKSSKMRRSAAGAEIASTSWKRIENSQKGRDLDKTPAKENIRGLSEVPMYRCVGQHPEEASTSGSVQISTIKPVSRRYFDSGSTMSLQSVAPEVEAPMVEILENAEDIPKRIEESECYRELRKSSVPIKVREIMKNIDWTFHSSGFVVTGDPRARDIGLAGRNNIGGHEQHVKHRGIVFETTENILQNALSFSDDSERGFHVGPAENDPYPFFDRIAVTMDEIMKAAALRGSTDEFVSQPATEIELPVPEEVILCGLQELSNDLSKQSNVGLSANKSESKPGSPLSDPTLGTIHSSSSEAMKGSETDVKDKEETVMMLSTQYEEPTPLLKKLIAPIIPRSAEIKGPFDESEDVPEESEETSGDVVRVGKKIGDYSFLFGKNTEDTTRSKRVSNPPRYYNPEHVLHIGTKTRTDSERVKSALQNVIQELPDPSEIVPDIPPFPLADADFNFDINRYMSILESFSNGGKRIEKTINNLMYQFPNGTLNVLNLESSEISPPKCNDESTPQNADVNLLNGAGVADESEIINTVHTMNTTTPRIVSEAESVGFSEGTPTSSFESSLLEASNNQSERSPSPEPSMNQTSDESTRTVHVTPLPNFTIVEKSADNDEVDLDLEEKKKELERLIDEEMDQEGKLSLPEKRNIKERSTLKTNVPANILLVGDGEEENAIVPTNSEMTSRLRFQEEIITSGYVESINPGHVSENLSDPSTSQKGVQFESVNAYAAKTSVAIQGDDVPGSVEISGQLNPGKEQPPDERAGVSRTSKYVDVGIDHRMHNDSFKIYPFCSGVDAYSRQKLPEHPPPKGNKFFYDHECEAKRVNYRSSEMELSELWFTDDDGFPPHPIVKASVKKDVASITTETVPDALLTEIKTAECITKKIENMLETTLTSEEELEKKYEAVIKAKNEVSSLKTLSFSVNCELQKLEKLVQTVTKYAVHDYCSEVMYVSDTNVSGTEEKCLDVPKGIEKAHQQNTSSSQTGNLQSGSINDNSTKQGSNVTLTAKRLLNKQSIVSGYENATTSVPVPKPRRYLQLEAIKNYKLIGSVVDVAHRSGYEAPLPARRKDQAKEPWKIDDGGGTKKPETPENLDLKPAGSRNAATTFNAAITDDDVPVTEFEYLRRKHLPRRGRGLSSGYLMDSDSDGKLEAPRPATPVSIRRSISSGSSMKCNKCETFINPTEISEIFPISEQTLEFIPARPMEVSWSSSSKHAFVGTRSFNDYLDDVKTFYNSDDEGEDIAEEATAFYNLDKTTEKMERRSKQPSFFNIEEEEEVFSMGNASTFVTDQNSRNTLRRKIVEGLEKPELLAIEGMIDSLKELVISDIEDEAELKTKAWKIVVTPEFTLFGSLIDYFRMASKAMKPASGPGTSHNFHDDQPSQSFTDPYSHPYCTEVEANDHKPTKNDEYYKKITEMLSKVDVSSIDQLIAHCRISETQSGNTDAASCEVLAKSSEVSSRSVAIETDYTTKAFKDLLDMYTELFVPEKGRPSRVVREPRNAPRDQNPAIATRWDFYNKLNADIFKSGVPKEMMPKLSSRRSSSPAILRSLDRTEKNYHEQTKIATTESDTSGTNNPEAQSTSKLRIPVEKYSSGLVFVSNNSEDSKSDPNGMIPKMSTNSSPLDSSLPDGSGLSSEYKSVAPTGREIILASVNLINECDMIKVKTVSDTTSSSSSELPDAKPLSSMESDRCDSTDSLDSQNTNEASGCSELTISIGNHTLMEEFSQKTRGSFNSQARSSKASHNRCGGSKLSKRKKLKERNAEASSPRGSPSENTLKGSDNAGSTSNGNRKCKKEKKPIARASNEHKFNLKLGKKSKML